MVSRRLLRIKVLKILYAYFKSGKQSQIAVERELAFSVKKTYDLYHYMLMLVPEIADFAEIKIEIGKNKYFPTEEEKNPNRKFINNKAIKLIRENKALKKYISQEKLSWVDSDKIINKLYSNIINTDFFKEYMKSEERSFKEDKALVCKILETQIEDFDDIYNWVEDKNIFWIDDLEFVLSMAIKTIKSFKENQSEYSELMLIYKSESDKEFGIRLLRRVINDSQHNEKIIDENTKNWDVERIAFMDTLILQMIIAEACEFIEIPINVTIDEYIELSKYFSSPASSSFINGVADKILSKMAKDKVFIKSTD